MNPRYIVTVEFENIRAEVWLNHIPVGAVTQRTGSPVVLPVNQFIVEGPNKLGLLLHYGPSAADPSAAWSRAPEAQHYSGPASVKATVALYQPEQMPLRDHPPALATVEWKGVTTPQPSYTQQNFQAPQNFGKWLWETAATLPPMDLALRDSAVDYLSHLYQMLSQRNFERYIAESEKKFNEMGHAYGMPMDGMREAMLGQLHAQEQEHLVPFQPSAIELRAVADNRMLECLRHGREYLFEYEQANSANKFFLPLMIGQVQNKWTILR